jgi:hypothetical protein
VTDLVERWRAADADEAPGAPERAATRSARVRRRRLPRVERRTAIALAITLVLVTLPLWEVVLGKRTGMYGDTNDMFVPSYVGVWRAISAGHSPWWIPNVFAGVSSLGAGEYAVFYPFNVVFAVLNPVTAYRVWLLLHVWITAAGAFTWAWHRWRSRPGAIVAAVAYTHCGFVVFHLMHPPFIVATAWLPWLFYGVDLVYERWTVRRAALVAVPLALIAFGGQPQMLWIALVGIGAYAFSMFFFTDDRAMCSVRVLGATAIGLGFSAVQLLPQYHYGQSSQRPKLPMDGAFSIAEKPHHLWQMVFPFLFGGSSQGTVFSHGYLGGDSQTEVGMFVGGTILALAGIALIVRRKDALVRTLALISLVAVLICLAGSTPFGHFVYSYVPLSKSFRGWARTQLLLGLTFSMLAAAGVAEVMRVPRRYVQPLFVSTGLVLAIAIALPHMHSVNKEMVGGPYGLLARGLPVFWLLGLAAAVTVMTVRPKLGVVLLVAMCVGEVTTFTYQADWRGNSISSDSLHHFYDEHEPPTFGDPVDAPGGVDRWASDTYGFRMVSIAKNMRSVNGYDPLMQRDWAETAGGFTYDGYPQRTDLWGPGWLSDELRVSTLVLNKHLTPYRSWVRGAPVPGSDYVRWNRDPRLPEAYLVGSVQVDALPGIRRRINDPATPMTTTAYVEQSDGRVASLADARVPGHVVSADVLGSGNVVVDTERNGFLVLSHSWESGWHATVDGHATPVLRTNGLVLGVYVPAGRHTVHLHFTPPGLHEGAWLAFAALLLLFAIAPLGRHAGVVWDRRKRSTPPDALEGRMQ